MSLPPVLLVDDVALMRMVVRTVLAQAGFEEIDEAPDGEAALARLHARRYGLVIADCNMAPVSGLELLRRLRADANLRRTPFVMMTTKEHVDSLVRARQTGANACLVKPFTLAALRYAVQAFVPTSQSPAEPVRARA